jgi:hypothetical protein
MYHKISADPEAQNYLISCAIKIEKRTMGDLFLSSKKTLESSIEKSELVTAYRNLKDTLGITPSSEDVDIFGKYDVSKYVDKWGTWEKFLADIGESPLISAELILDLVKEYYEERELFGDNPSTEEIDEHGIFKVDDYTRVFGSWINFLMYVEELDKSKGIRVKEKVSKEELVKDYYLTKEKLGHVPSIHDMNNSAKYGVDYHTYHYGSYGNFLKAIQEKTTLKCSIEDLKSNYFDVKLKIGKQPTSTDLQYNGRFSYQVYMKRFGSYNNFLQSVGEPSITKQELFQDYFKVKAFVRKDPTINDMNANSKYHISIYQRRFGSWLNFLDEVKVFKT